MPGLLTAMVAPTRDFKDFLPLLPYLASADAHGAALLNPHSKRKIARCDRHRYDPNGAQSTDLLLYPALHGFSPHYEKAARRAAQRMRDSNYSE